mgnify:CR=1 FL=1
MPRKQNQKSDAEPKGSSAAGSPNSRRNLVISDKQSNWKSFVAGSILGVLDVLRGDVDLAHHAGSEGLVARRGRVALVADEQVPRHGSPIPAQLTGK